MAGIPPPPSYMNPSSPAFAEWMRAIAKGLDGYREDALNWSSFVTNEQFYNRGAVPKTWLRLMEFTLDGEAEEGTLYEIDVSVVSQNSGYDYTSELFNARITKGRNDTVLISAPPGGMTVWATHYVDKPAKQEVIDNYSLWVQSRNDIGLAMYTLLHSASMTVVRR